MSMMTTLFDEENIEVKRRKNLEDNRRFLAALKINDIRNEIKEINNNEKEDPGLNSRRNAKQEFPSDRVLRSTTIRTNYGEKENVPLKKKKKLITTDENRTEKVKLQLPEHMLVRYHSGGKKVALHNPKVKFGDDENDNLLF